MGLIKLLVAPIRRLVNFPLFQLAVAVAVILFLKLPTAVRYSAGSSARWITSSISA